jgi:hypothetical protein
MNPIGRFYMTNRKPDPTCARYHAQEGPMSMNIRSTTDSRLEIDGTRPRQTERPGTGFRGVLAGGASLLLAGAEVGAHVVGGPILAAAVHDARVGTTGAIAGSAPGAAAAGTNAAGVGAGAALAAAAGTPGGEAGNVQALLQDGPSSNLQLLALQQQVQQENQRFSTLSNVMRAKHDTAKAAVSNIRA